MPRCVGKGLGLKGLEVDDKRAKSMESKAKKRKRKPDGYFFLLFYYEWINKGVNGICLYVARYYKK